MATISAFNLGLDNTINNQSMESVRAARHKQPPQMGQAHGADDNPPLVPFKPGKLLRKWTGICTSCYQLKTGNLKYHTVWVGKSMFVAAIANDTLIVGTDDLMTLAAADIVFWSGFLILGLIGFNYIWQYFEWFLRTIS